MTKEELKNEAAAYAKKHHMLFYCDPADVFVSDEEEIINAILHFAEPREKRIAELEALIEKMKCCSNCKNCRRKFIKKNVFEYTCKVEHCKNYDKWEIRK